MMVEMACLYTSCECPSRRSNTQKLSNQVTTPCSLTPFTRKIVSGVLFLRTWLRKVSCRFCERSAAVVVFPLFLEVILLADYCQAAAPNFRLVLSTGLGALPSPCTSASGASVSWGQTANFLVRDRARQLQSACSWNFARRAVATEPGTPLPIDRASIRTTGRTTWLAEVKKASRAA